MRGCVRAGPRRLLRRRRRCRSRRPVDVVVEFEVADSLADELVNDRVEVRTCCCRPEVEMEPVVLTDPFAAPVEERFFGEVVRVGAVHADDLGFEPDACPHTSCLDAIEDSVEPSLESVIGLLPRPDRRPPVAAGGVGVPTCVDAKHFRPDCGRAVDQRQEFSPSMAPPSTCS